MSLVRRLRGDETPAPIEQRSGTVGDWGAWQNFLGMVYGGAGTSLASAASIDGALRHPVVYRSVNKIAGIVAQFPWHLMRDRETLTTPRLLTDPSPGVLRPSAWKRTAATSMLLAGGANCYLDDVRPSRLDLIDPARVAWSKGRGWTIDDERVAHWPEGPLWHVPYMTLPGSPKGVNPLEYARRTVYAGLAAQEFGGNFFRDGAHPTAIIAPESDPGVDGAKELKQRVMAATSGTDREPLVLPQNTTYTQIQIDPEDSQFIELMKFSGAEVAGFFGLQPEHVGLPVEGSGLQYSNRENRQQDLLQDAVMPVLLPLEEALTELFPSPRRVKFNVEGLLRADQAARFSAYKTAAEIEQITGDPLLLVDEMRELENREPLSED